MIKKIKRLWLMVRPPHRITQYGTCAINYFDERTPLERYCDKVDRWIERVERRQRQSRSQVWHTFFDVSTGTYITSMDDIKRIEREKGWIYGNFSDINKEAKKHDENNLKMQHEKINKDMKQMYKEVKQGRSFIKETNDKIRAGHYKTGQVRAMNG